MRKVLKIKVIIALLFSMSIWANTTIAALVPLVSNWQSGSPDYRSFDDGVMTINVTDPETGTATWPRANYPGDQDFTVTVDFSNYFIGASSTPPLSGSNPTAFIGIKWRIADVNGSPAYSQIDIRRSSFNDGSDGFQSIYESYGNNYSQVHQNFVGTSNDLNGTFIISKTGNSVTVSVKNTIGTVLHTWIFPSITTFAEDISVLFAVVTGSKASTSVQFANFDMDPVPVDVLYFDIQKRYKEEVGEFNRCSYSVVDTSGTPVADEVFSSVQLFDPTDNAILFDSQSFSGIYSNLNGRYDASNGRWIYDSFTQMNYFAGKFAGNLQVGQYHLVTTTNSGITYHRYINYPGAATLPIISSTSFYAYKDANGNLLFSWKVPYDSNLISSGLNTSVRAWVDVYDGDTLKAELIVTIPTHMGNVFFPSNIVQLYETMGTDYRIGVHLRTTNSSTRSYSSTVPLVLAAGPPVIGDVNGDGKVGLVEAINALNVAAGGH